MLPLVGWYFGDADEGAGDDEGGNEIEVRFLCTATLSADFGAAAAAFGVDLAPMQSLHKSAVSSDATEEALSIDPSQLLLGGVHKESTAGLTLSAPNKAWLEEVYKKDADFVEERCGDKASTNPAGGPPGKSTAVFVCPRGEKPGTCIGRGRKYHASTATRSRTRELATEVGAAAAVAPAIPGRVAESGGEVGNSDKDEHGPGVGGGAAEEGGGKATGMKRKISKQKHKEFIKESKTNKDTK
jgi:hypothetical protein